MYLTLSQIKAKYGIHPQTMRYWIKKGIISSRQMFKKGQNRRGATLYVLETDIPTYLRK